MKPFWVLLVFALAACGERTVAPVVPSALNVGEPKTVFVGTTRSKNDAGEFGIGRSPSLSLLQLTVSLPPKREIGSISDGGATPDPKFDFVIANQLEYDNRGSFQEALRQEFAQRGSDGQREATIYVHGYNNSFADAAFRMAQLSHDLDLPGPVISYSWSSRANALGYEYDSDSAVFARNGLQELLLSVKDAGLDRIVLVGHSMGGRVVMETLRDLEQTKPGWAARSMSGVLLISPDVNLDVFRSQTTKFTEWPQPFVIFSSRKDKLLRLSARLRGERQRLGNLADVQEISDLPISFVDVTSFSDGDSSNHFVAGSSGSFLQILRSTQDLDQAFLRGQTNATVLGGSRVIGQAVEFTPEIDRNR